MARKKQFKEVTVYQEFTFYMGSCGFPKAPILTNKPLSRPVHICWIERLMQESMMYGAV